ncbi:HDL472Cp [Eremothecium sinecaudum]|uniref:HDL472Cp n=1 Tax=Eremothecium sinecaudum TaxID=45286 RepID=A0A0X8HRR1_9SACH|nr:HDL472Cp [Eremothecium sinecaudum]AMD20272.1 HDL472Cp [Eremothecium sinecaudum]
MSNTNKETRAQFVDESHGLPYGGKSSQTLRSALKRRKAHSSTGVEDEKGSKNSEQVDKLVVSSPLLNSTPPTVTKSLVKLYPYLIIADRALGTLIWTNDDVWESILMVICFIAGVSYFENLIKFFGHLLIVGILWGYSLLDKYVEETIRDRPTLDDIVQMMTRVVTKCDLMLSPISVLNCNDIKRLLFTMVFLSPVYMIITMFIVPPRKFILVAGVYLLTYHSSWSCVTRRLLWRFKLVRLLAFYVTGLDLEGVNKNQGGIFAVVHKKVKKLSGTNNGANDDGKPIRFTYVLYENQRRWLAIGWTANMLSYERSAWTDEFLNEAPPPDQFNLPEENSSMVWRWVDKTWRLDMTNDGAIHLPSSKPKTTATPNSDDGFIYYDNTWKKPSTEDSFSKYTRRRRWIRTAELYKVGSVSSVDDTFETTTNDNTNTNENSRPGLKFSEPVTSDDDETRGRKVSFSEVADVHIIPPVEEKETSSNKPTVTGPATERAKQKTSQLDPPAASSQLAQDKSPQSVDTTKVAANKKSV